VAEVGSVSVRVTAETAQFQSAMAGVDGRLRGFSSSVGAVGKALTLGLTVPLAGAAALAVKAFADFESSLNSFQAVAGATADEMEQVSAKAKALGADMSLPATSAKDAARAMTELAKGGLDVQESMDAAKGTLQLAAAAEIDVGEAATITADALNAFGLEAKESGRVSDLLAASANASTGEITDMADALKMSAAVANAAGVPIEDLVTAISEMANAGIKGSDAGTSLKQMLLSLQAPTDKAANLMRDLGIEVYDSQGRMKDMRSIVEEFSSALGDMTQEQRNAALATIFGSDAVRAANVVLMKGTKAWDEMKEAVTRSGAAQDLASAKMKGLRGAVEGLKSQIETAAIVFGERLAPAVERVTRFLADMVSKFTQLSPQAQSVVLAMAGLAAAIGPVLLIVTRLAPALALLVTPFGAVVAAVAAVGAAFAVAYTQSETFRAFIQGLMPILSELGAAIVSLATAIKDGLTAAFQALEPIIRPILSALGTYIQTVLKNITEYIKLFAALLRGDWAAAWNALKAIVQNAASGIQSVVSSMANAVRSVVSAAWSAIQSLSSSAWAAIRTAISAAWNAIRSATTTALNAIRTAVQTAWTAIRTTIGNMAQIIVTVVRNAWNTVRSTTQSVFNQVRNIAQSVWNTIRSVISAAANAIKGAIGGVVGAINGLIGAFRAVVGAAQAAASAIASAISAANSWNPFQIPGFAGGVQNFRGGLALVGEQGPELLSLPRGSDIYPASQTRAMLGGASAPMATPSAGQGGGGWMAPLVAVYLDGEQIAARVETRAARKGYRNPTIYSSGLVRA
jgi:TP901 family phage tail tape measure protein